MWWVHTPGLRVGKGGHVVRTRTGGGLGVSPRDGRAPLGYRRILCLAFNLLRRRSPPPPPPPHPPQISEKAIKEVPQVVRELVGLKAPWQPSDLLPVNPTDADVVEALREVSMST